MDLLFAFSLELLLMQQTQRADIHRRITSRCWAGADADADTGADGGADGCPHGRLVIKHKLRVDGALDVRQI